MEKLSHYIEFMKNRILPWLTGLTTQLNQFNVVWTASYGLTNENLKVIENSLNKRADLSIDDLQRFEINATFDKVSMKHVWDESFGNIEIEWDDVKGYSQNYI